MREVAALHASGLVAALGPDDLRETEDGTLSLVDKGGQLPRRAEDRLKEIQPHSGSALRIVGEYRVTTETDTGTRIEDLQSGSETTEIFKPVYLADYTAWEKRIGHHDEATDIFSVGLILASMACGLDFGIAEDVERFSRNRANLFRLNPSLHPVIAALIDETTALNRHERAADLSSIARRLADYREQPVGLDVDRVLAETSGVSGRRTAVLAHLRDRLFDLSRRNRLIHFRPTQASVNLTVASVPIVLRIESVRGDQLCTWNESFAKDVLGGTQVPLNRWLRFEDQPYLPSALDRILQEARRDRAEYGFSHLRLVIAFLHWRNLKEAPEEAITSPMLWLPVEVIRRKGVRDQYMLRCAETEAAFNPALRQYLRHLYDIRLPEAIDLTVTSLADVHRDVTAQIQASEPGVKLSLVSKPAIRLIHQKAVQRLRQFERRRPNGGRPTSVDRPDFSYDTADYRPLGLALFERYVRPSPLPQRIAAGGSLPPRADRIAPQAGATEQRSYVLGDDDRNRYSWEIDLTQVTLANFNYKKMSLVRDYNQLIDEPSEQPSLDRVFSIEPRAFETEPPPALPSSERWSVVPSDGTQDAAVALARTGRSFIIQGPPGTGKSQTITNLIADYAARGKRVLFVCEKRAALDVVFNRLRQSGLDTLACIIHDSQEDKKSFVLDLKGCYENWGRGDDKLDYRFALRHRTLSALDRHLERIASVDAAMGGIEPEAGANLRTLVRRLLTLPDLDSSPGAEIRERLPSLAEWDGQRSLIVRVQRAAADVLGLSAVAEHPFARLSPALVAAERTYAETERFVSMAETLLDALDAVLDDDASLITGNVTIRDAAAITDAASQALKTNLAAHLDLLDTHSLASADLASRQAEIVRLEEIRDAAREVAQHWRDPLTPEDTAAALDRARVQEPSFFRFFSGSWRRLKQTIGSRYDFAAHAVAPSITSVLEKLAKRHSAEAAVIETRRSLQDRLGTLDLEAFLALRAALAEPATPAVGALLARARGSEDPSAALAPDARAAQILATLRNEAVLHLEGADGLTLEEIAEELRDMREGLDELPELLPLLRSIDQAGPGVAFALRSLRLDPPSMEALIVDEAIARALRERPSLRGFDPSTLASSAIRASRARTLLQDDNAAAIQAASQRRFLDNAKRAMLSVTQLDGEGRSFKKLYSTGRRELEHEFGKSMRYRSIRDLASRETGMVVIDLKPIWLMSPLSVSDTLPLKADLFDVVIFDEASQIPTEEAVPALCRAPQVIIVGDEMQLPPTSFFAAARDDDDMQVTADEDGETISILLDADSLLNQAAKNLPATLLAWHYRSRSEALISFSNAAFYDGRLITVPDRRRDVALSVIEPVRSDRDLTAVSVDRLMARPLSFHAVADGLYEGRVNPPEARLIAGMVRELLVRETGLSIGIVAFSEAQQSEIEGALDAVALRDPAFAARLEHEFVREDDGQFNGLFVKNLENVQGDERDIILLSICYAPGRDGRMAMNFGPINQRGGEKRLNVIFSRARHHMAVVSTIRAEAITNTHNDGARALRTFLSFAEAQGKGDFARGQSILAAINPDAESVFGRSAPIDALRSAIADALRLRGHEVHEHVGGASFRCDLAIADQRGGGYVLAVLLDGGPSQDPGGVYGRFVFQPGLLRSFGWRVIDIPSQSWLAAPDIVIRQIESALLDNANNDDDDPFDDAAIPLPQQPPAPVHLNGEPAPASSRTDGFIEFEFAQGASRKFWKVGVWGVDMSVVYGRIGTKGSTVVKSFETPERARKEADKLILEKLRKGYVQVT